LRTSGSTVHARGSGSDVVLQFDANQNNYDTASLQQHLQNFLGLLETVAIRSEMPGASDSTVR